MKAMKVVIPALISVLFFVTADMGAAMECYDCHGTTATADYRPNDAIYRNITTGAFKGNHRTHMGGGATPASCVACHGSGVASYTNAHRGGTIDMAANINTSPKAGGATYSRGSSFSQSASPTLGTCASVNCHFEAATPTWGADSALTTCSTCHGAAPADGSHPAASGSGKKHGDYYGLTTSSCAKCHPDHTTDGAPFAHATSAGNRALAVAFNTVPNNGFGRYTGNVNYPNYLPSQSPPRNGTCKNLYCHSPGNKASNFDLPNTTATWGGSLTCTGCHKADAASGSYLTSGSHGGHLYSWGGMGASQKCARCHAATATGSMTIAEYSRHVNKQVEVAFGTSTSAASGKYATQAATPASPAQKAPGSAVGQCENVYCHSTGQGDGGTWPPTYQAPTWGTASTGICGTCHGIQKTHGNGVGFYIGTATPLTTGSHAKHLSFIMGFSGAEKCTACHAYTLTGFSPTTCSSVVCHTGDLVQTSHPNYAVNVGIPDYYGASASYSGTAKPGDGYGSCSNNYCHSDGKASPTTYATPTWGNVASGACGTCHGVTAAAPPASVPHAKHMGSANPYRFACAECHSGKVQVTANSTTAPAFTNLTSHVDKTRNVKFDSTNTFGTYSTATLSCRNLYCHSTGNTSVAAGDLPGVYGGKVYSRITWSGSTTCTSCHGRSTANGMPDYTNAGAPGSAIANSHAKHVSSSNIQCVECHEKTTKNNTSIRSTAPSYHVNGTNHDVFFNLSGNSAAGTYDDAQKKCSATYCHGAGASLAWGGTTYCNSCHSANAASSGGGGVNNWGSGTPASAHKLHWEDASALPSKYTNYSTGNVGSAGTYRFACASCHNPASASHVSGYASGSYRAQVFFGYTTPGKKPTYTYTGTAGTADNGFSWSNGNTACTATYCHSNGAGGTGAAVTWATTANSATNTRCKTCHAYTTASGSAIATGDHTAHVNGATYNFSCRKCHAATTTDGTSITDKTKHVNKSINIAFNNSTTAVSGTYNGTASPMAKNPGSAYGSCANTYCHGLGTSTTPTTPNVTPTWGGALNATCSGCHGNDNSAAYKMGTVGSAAHAKHVQTYGHGCVKCHDATVSDSRTIDNYANHVNRQVNVAFNNSTTAVSGTYNGVASPMTKLPGSATGTCTNTYCHSKGTSTTPSSAPPNIVPNWTSNLDATCSSCHGNDSTAGYKMGTVGSSTHTAHVQTYTSFTCDYCHAATVSNSRTVATLANHVNRKVDVQFNAWVNSAATYGGATPNSKLPGAAMTNCANTYCHSNGTSVSTGSIPANTTVNWGTAGPLACNACHGNATYGSDYRKATPLYASGSPKANAHQLHIDQSAGGGTPAAADPQCLHCHAATTTTNTSITNTANHVAKSYNVGMGGTFADGDNIGGAAVTVAMTYTYAAGGSSCSGVSCHPTGLSGAKSTDSAPWSDKQTCDDCHKVNLNNNTGYHHAMRNYSGSGASYPKAIPGATAGANDVNRRCTMCHVDHATFSPSLNASNTTYGSAGNLRMSIYSSVTATKGYINRDFFKTGSGGICVSCHNSELFKDTGNVRVKNETNSTKTVAIVLNNYTGSAHEYAISSTMRRDSQVFYSDCSKCHNGRRSEVAVFSGMTTATHDRDVRRIYASLGTSLTDGNDENFCYRCHSATTDTSPGGGPAKAVANKDYYRTASMSTGAEKIFALFQKTYKHNVAGYTGTHKPSATDETSAYLTANRHVECADCHNVHAATAAAPLRGATGIDPTTPAAGSTPTYTVVTVTDPDQQYKVCFKCHTNWAGYGTGTTNLAVDFNTSNDSFHWVEKDKFTYAVNTGTGRGIWKLAQFNLNAVPTQGTKKYVEVMMPRTGITYDHATLRTLPLRCSDCHGSDGSDGGVNVPEGPHGSTVANILKVPAGSPYTTWNATTSSLTGDTWCLNCHDPTFANSGFKPSAGHLYGGSGKHQRACQYCHLAIPHGSGSQGAGAANQRKHLLKPTTFTEGIDSETSGSQGQHGWVIPGCT